MLFRCDITPQIGLHDLNQCLQLGTYFQALGYRTAYAVNRAGVERAREFLPKGSTVYRIPDTLEEDAERLGHLGRTHKHHNVFIALRQATSTYTFQVHRLFDFTAVIDRGSPFLIYTNLLINAALDATNFSYNCSSQARLLLGPKFHICNPAPVAPPQWEEPPKRVLINLSSCMPLLEEVVHALAGLAGGPTIHLLMPNDEDQEHLEALVAQYPGAECQVIVPGEARSFTYHDYPLIITEASDLCMDLAWQGLCFVTAAVLKDQVARAYALDQLGVAPTLGWYSSKKATELRKLFGGLLTDLQRRQQHSRAGRQLIDGQGVPRIARFVPKEA